MAGVGRPIKCNAKVARAIAKLVKKGISLRQAAEQSGVDGSQVFEWFNRAGEPYDSFTQIVKQAIATGKKPKQAG